MIDLWLAMPLIWWSVWCEAAGIKPGPILRECADVLEGAK